MMSLCCRARAAVVRGIAVPSLMGGAVYEAVLNMIQLTRSRSPKTRIFAVAAADDDSEGHMEGHSHNPHNHHGQNYGDMLRETKRADSANVVVAFASRPPSRDGRNGRS